MVEQQSEQDRIQALLTPLRTDKKAWENSFSPEEQAAGGAFEEQLKTNPETLQAFMAEINETFATCDVNGDNLLDKTEFKAFVTTMNNHGVSRGLKNRDTTDEFINMVFPCFDGFTQGVEGVSKGEILTILNLLNQPVPAASDE